MMEFAADPFWKDYLLFCEHFHGDTGAGLGASHQAGWTTLITRLVVDQARASQEPLQQKPTKSHADQ